MKRHFRFFLRTLLLIAASLVLSRLAVFFLTRETIWVSFLLMIPGPAVDLVLRIRALRDPSHALWQGEEAETQGLKTGFWAVTIFEGIVVALLVVLCFLLSR